MREWPVDLFSDTKTRPDAAMRSAMAAAVVGDEQQDEDPTVEHLTERVAAMLGKPRAIFLPSGTMANLASILVHCSRGEEILAEASSHLFHFETGGPAGVAGAVVTPMAGSRGMFTEEQLAAALRAPRRNAPRPRLVWIEQTTNLGGGAVWPLQRLQAVKAWAECKGLAVHMDGARLLNAAVAHDLEPSVYGSVADSIWIDFSKGLGAPFGAVLAGSEEFVSEAIRYKHMLGGAMRQAGIMAAACLHALDHNVRQLSHDHEAARRLAAGLRALGGVEIDGDIETNIVIADVGLTGLMAADIATKLAAQGIRIGVFGPTKIRLVTHRDVQRDGIDAALVAFGAALGSSAA